MCQDGSTAALVVQTVVGRRHCYPPTSTPRRLLQNLGLLVQSVVDNWQNVAALNEGLRRLTNRCRYQLPWWLYRKEHRWGVNWTAHQGPMLSPGRACPGIAIRRVRLANTDPSHRVYPQSERCVLGLSSKTHPRRHSRWRPFYFAKERFLNPHIVARTHSLRCSKTPRPHRPRNWSCLLPALDAAIATSADANRPLKQRNNLH